MKNPENETYVLVFFQTNHPGLDQARKSDSCTASVVDTRLVRDLAEVLFQAVTKTFVLSEALNMKPGTVRKLEDQGALAHLIQIRGYDKTG